MKKINKLELINRCKHFGKNFRNLGIGLLVIIGILSLITLWTIIYTYYEPYQQIAVMFLKVIDLGIKVTAVGIFINLIFYFIEDLLIKKEMKKYEVKTNGRTKKAKK
jgi:hypothetical protein